MRKTLRSNRHGVPLGACAAATLLVIAPFANGSFISVPAIDPASDANDIDQDAVHAAHTGVATAANVVNLATFRSAVSAAFAQNFGGVIDFETRNDAGGNPIGSLDSSTAFSARYGAGGNAVSGAKALTIGTASGTWSFPGVTSNGRIPTSGANGLGKSGTDVFTFDILDGAIANGEEGERVTWFGFTVLERTGADVGSPLSAIATFSDGSTVTAQAQINNALPANDQDSFYGFVAPAGMSITSVTFNPGNFTTVDDIAFITETPGPVVPEPSATLAGGLVAAAALLRQKRRR